MKTFYDYMQSAEGKQEAKGKRFEVVYEELTEYLGEFSHISEYYLAEFKDGEKVTRMPLHLDGKDNPGLKFIFEKI